MPDPKDLQEEDWERISRLYQTDLKVADIAQEYGLNSQTIVARARLENWPLRGERLGKGAPSIKLGAAKPGTADPATLRKRLTALVERQIAEIEGRLADADDNRDQERDARTLSNLTRTLDKLIELKRAAARERAETKRLKEVAAENADPRNEDELRADLARRLSRLTASGDETPLPGGTDTS